MNKSKPRVMTPDEVVLYDKRQAEEAEAEKEMDEAFEAMFQSRQKTHQGSLYGPWPPKVQDEQEIIPGKPSPTWTWQEVAYLAMQEHKYAMDKRDAEALILRARNYSYAFRSYTLNRQLIVEFIKDFVDLEIEGWNDYY